MNKLLSIHSMGNRLVTMMTSSNGNIFRVTGPLCGEFTGPGEFPTQRPVTRSFDVYFDLRLNKRLCKQSWGWWFETLLCPLWRHSNALFSASRPCDVYWTGKLHPSQYKNGLSRYGDFHYKYKTVMKPSYRYNENSHTWKDRLYIETGPWVWWRHDMKIGAAISVPCFDQISKRFDNRKIRSFGQFITRAQKLTNGLLSAAGVRCCFWLNLSFDLSLHKSCLNFWLKSEIRLKSETAPHPCSVLNKSPEIMLHTDRLQIMII